jgi:hypothetical protein
MYDVVAREYHRLCSVNLTALATFDTARGECKPESSTALQLAYLIEGVTGLMPQVGHEN